MFAPVEYPRYQAKSANQCKLYADDVAPDPGKIADDVVSNKRGADQDYEHTPEDLAFRILQAVVFAANGGIVDNLHRGVGLPFMIVDLAAEVRMAIGQPGRKFNGFRKTVANRDGRALAGWKGCAFGVSRHMRRGVEDE